MGHYFINDENLKSEIKEFKTNISGSEFIFKTDNGVFSKGELDFGTKLLIENVLKEDISGKVLDFGCGYGVIGIVLAKLKNVNMTMVDVNNRAIHLTKKNILENNIQNAIAFSSDGFTNIDKKFNYIVSNPPIRIGKVRLYEIIKDMKNYLESDGVIYLVIRKEQGAKSFIKDFCNEYEIQVLDKSKGFYIISLKCC
ncbi:MAG: class I SAM-dependent methyltransferase [Bacilli bacterium]|nr:class I SAM-dependent methyltransferase [Bacilli bacterium]